MKYSIKSISLLVVVISIVFSECNIPGMIGRTPNRGIPETYDDAYSDTANTAIQNWRNFFTDPDLQNLIDSALQNNQELNIMMQEIAIANNEVLARKGEYLPFVHAGVGSGVEKVGRYTSQGANDANTDIAPGKETPEWLGDGFVMARATWEIDIWHKLHNAKDAAIQRYLASAEGKNFMTTQIVSEVAQLYYELLALDNHLLILKNNIAIQQNALEVIRKQKEAAKATELAVKKFEAEVLKNQSLQYNIEQQIIVTENSLNVLVGRYPQHVNRSSQRFLDMDPFSIQTGLPSQLLENRPDVKQAEYNLEASKLDVKVAKADFYPSLGISSDLGFQAFNPAYFIKLPQSLLFSLAGDMVAPLVNRKAIIAKYSSANASQIQAAYEYERILLNAYTEVVNQMRSLDKIQQGYSLKNDQVRALVQSIDIVLKLFKYARADYMEVLMTQRDALEAKMELVETKRDQFVGLIRLYKALGGGWQ